MWEGDSEKEKGRECYGKEHGVIVRKQATRGRNKQGSSAGTKLAPNPCKKDQKL